MSNPNVPFYQLPKTGTFSYQPFAVGSDYKFPDYFTSVFKPTEAQAQAKGTNTTSGGRDQPALSYQSASNALPDMPGNMQDFVDFIDAINESSLQKQIKASLVSQGLTQQQLASVYPFLRQAAKESTERNLLASQIYADFKERLPSSMQNIAASQQNQAAQAAGAQAQLMSALANLKGASRGFRGYRGQTFSFG